MPPKRLVLFCEGQGDEGASRLLVDRLLTQLDRTRRHLFLDPDSFRIGDLTKLVNKDRKKFEKKEGETFWVNKLASAAKRKNVGAMLLLLDGDYDGELFHTSDGHRSFCAKDFALLLAQQAQSAGAGRNFSLAVVFARQEFESWLIAGCPEFHEYAPKKPEEIEKLRGAKEWIGKHRHSFYKPTRHQAELTQTLDIHAPLLNQMRSFQRLKNAMSQLVQAVCENQPVCTPGKI